MKQKISTLKEKVWKNFSQYIRQRDADWRGYVKCFTCSARKHWKEVDAGHYISRNHNSVLFDEQNVHAQCKKCNGFNSGMHDVYALRLKQKYGDNILEELNERKVEKRWTVEELEELNKEILNKPKQL